MSVDRKIKKAIRDNTKPRLSFSEFCENSGIESKVDANQNGVGVRAKARASRIVGAVMCCCLAAIIIAVVIVNYRAPIANPLPELRFYGEDAVEESFMENEQFFAEQVPTLIDFDKVEQVNSIFRVTPIGEDLLLGYSIHGILYGFYSNETLYAFDLDMTIRCYEGYMFAATKLFENPTYTYGENCSYSVSENNNIAYVAVKRQDYDYFITVKEYSGITPVTKENVETFLDDVL